MQMRSILAEAVAGWAAPPPDHPVGAVPAQPSMHFVLRSVATNSYSTDVPSLDVSIPGVPGLAPQPSAEDDPSFADDIHKWTLAATGWKQAASAASGTASKLSAQVLSFQILRNTWSGIYSCLAAAATQLAPAYGPRTRLAVMSDMENNEAVTGLNLAGDSVLLVTICPSQASNGCPKRFASARTYLLRHGASSVAIVRSDAVTASTFDSFWRGS